VSFEITEEGLQIRRDVLDEIDELINTFIDIIDMSDENPSVIEGLITEDEINLVINPYRN
jgi:hypothetical protein